MVGRDEDLHSKRNGLSLGNVNLSLGEMKKILSAKPICGGPKPSTISLLLQLVVYTVSAYYAFWSMSVLVQISSGFFRVMS